MKCTACGLPGIHEDAKDCMVALGDAYLTGPCPSNCDLLREHIHRSERLAEQHQHCGLQNLGAGIIVGAILLVAYDCPKGWGRQGELQGESGVQ